ncbi:MAG: HEAT repeat domain-containing protein [Ignavibacteriaceae bacterium]|jgi:hypothetical protein
MEHQTYKEMLQLALLDELNDNELYKLHQHLIECSQCQAEYDKLKKYYDAVDQNKIGEIDEQFLQEARRQFRLKLDFDLSKQTIIEKVFNVLRRNLWAYKKPVFAGAFSLAVGLFLGYLLFTSDGSVKISSLTENLGLTGGNTEVANVQFVNSVPNNGEVEFSFDEVKRVTMKGKLNDPAVQKILANALVNEKSPGTRIQTVNALANQTMENNKANPKVKSALITALKFDGNPAVRMEALKALLYLPYDDEINESLLYALEHDKNSGLRVAAINGLASAKLNGKTIGQEGMKVLNQKVKNDDNEYVRIRAASLLKEEKIQ